MISDDNSSASSAETLDEAQILDNTVEPSAEAAPSTAEGDNEATEFSAIDIVRDVVAQKTEAAATSPVEGSETTDPVGEVASTEPDDENFSDAPFHKHPRFKKLIAQRDQYREGATRYENVEKFLSDNGLDGNEAFNGLAAIALAKSDPVKCWQTIKPWVQQLLVSAGEVLPEPLDTRVQRGELSYQDALELSRAQSRVMSVEARTQWEQQRAEQNQQQQLHQQIQDTVSNWENDRTIKDPSFAQKYPLVLKELKLLQFDEGVPGSPRAVQDQLNRAYQAANDAYRPPAPTVAPAVKKPVRPVTSAQTAGAVRAAPESTLDIIRQVTGR